MKKLNWVIIGSGVIANEMAQALLDVNGEIYAVGHRDMNKAIDFAMKYKIKNAYGSVEELLNDPDVDVLKTHRLVCPARMPESHRKMCILWCGLLQTSHRSAPSHPLPPENSYDV